VGLEGVRLDEGACFLVTGGAGFIGSALCETLVRMGHRVRCLDNLSTGNMQNIATLLETEAFEFIEGDIRDIAVCVAASRGVDYVLHQAAWGSVPRSIAMPLVYEQINVGGTLNMLEACRQNEVRKFVYASSSSVYGDSSVLPRREGSEGRALSPYALTKRACEEYGRLYSSLYGLDTCGLRYFNVFGRRQDPNGQYAAVIPRFIKQLLSGEAPVIHGDGQQTRDFTFIDNVVEANLRACTASRQTSGQVFNVACGSSERLIDVLDVLADSLGVVTSPVFGPARPGDVRDSHADISKARLLLGYDPRYDFADGVALAIDWYRGQSA